MTEGKEDSSLGPAPPPGSACPSSSTGDTRQAPEEKPKETEAAGGSEEGAAEGAANGVGGSDGERLGALGIVALPGTCCVCVEIEQINNCLHSEKICILPILACLLSLALCTAGLKWVFVDKIFEYEPPTHLDPKRIGQDPAILPVDPTLGLTVSVPHLSPSTLTLTSTNALSPGRPDVLLEDKFTGGPYMPQLPQWPQSDPPVTLKYNVEHPTTPKQAPYPQTTQESNSIIVPTVSSTSTTTTRTSSHVTRCSDSQRNYCVNGGECFTLEIMPGSTKFLCRCPNEFTGDRCQNYVMASFYKAEELYQKRILTITGICIALLVVGIMCLVAYCKTKKQRKELHVRLRQSLRKRRNNGTNAGICPNLATSNRGCHISNLSLQDLQLMNCNGTIMQHSAEKETETTFSTTKHDLAGHKPIAFNNISSPRLKPAPSCASVETSGSPSETSAPLCSLAVSEPSVVLSPSGEEERPLLLLNTHHTHMSSNQEHRRSSAHYNHGHVANSLPPSPLFTMENGTYQIIGDVVDFSDQRAGFTNGCLPHDVESMREAEALLLRALSSRTNPAPPNHNLQDKSTSATKPDPVIVESKN